MTRIKNYLLQFVQMQLIITIIALPILIHWGLSMSVMSLVGNFIFTPIFALVIILSSLIFYTELLCIPNSFLVTCYEHVISFWDRILDIGQKSWLVEYAHPGLWVLLSIPLITILFLCSRRVNTIYKRILGMFIILVLSTVVLSYIQVQKVKSYTHDFNHEDFVIKINSDKTLTFIDNGFFNSKRSPEKVVEFELKQFITKKYGSTVFAELILMRPGFRSFEGAYAFCQQFHVRKVIMSELTEAKKKKLTNQGWSIFFKFTDYLRDNNIELSSLFK
ncbi:MAG: hypothetical protein ABH827_00255 [bacterium]